MVGGVSSGLFQAQTIVSSSIIAANTAGDVGRGVLNTFVSEGYNLIGFGPATGRFNQPGDQTSVVDPQLAELEDNGGPTLTHRLGIGSPAIDAGDPTAIAGDDVPEFDQRGTPFPRVFDGRIDIGAFEFQPTPPASLVVSTTLDEFDADYSPGDLSLREAINFANLLPGADVIQFDPTLFATQRSISLTLGQLNIESEITLIGPGADLLTIDGRRQSRIFDISEFDETQQFDVATSGLTLTGGAATQPGSLRGGAIHSREQLTLSGMVIAGNTATLEGGGVYIRAFSPDALRLEDSTFVGNQAEAGGGLAIGSNSFGHVEIVNSTLSGNQSTLPGSGILSVGGSLFVRLTTVAENEVTGGAGGAIARTGEAMLLENSIVGNNTDAGGTPDLTGPVQARFSLIEHPTGAELTDEGGNLLGVDPMLGPLADNGGPTLTHALLAGSPAIDMGDPNFDATAFDPPLFTDQRGAPYVRVAGGRVDIGAFELQATPGDYLAGDYDGNNLVDAADYTVWRDTLGAMVVPFTEADGNGSGVIDEGDYAIWRTNFGQAASLNTAGLRAASLPLDAPPVETTADSDAAATGATTAQAAIAELEVFYSVPRRTPLAEDLPAPRAAFTDTATDAALLLLAREAASESPDEKVQEQADRWARDADGLAKNRLVSSEQGNSNAKPASLGSLEQRP